MGDMKRGRRRWSDGGRHISGSQANFMAGRADRREADNGRWLAPSTMPRISAHDAAMPLIEYDESAAATQSAPK